MMEDGRNKVVVLEDSDKPFRVLFLGTRGVIGYDGMEDAVSNNYMAVSKESIHNLNCLIKEYNLMVVVTGSMRFFKSTDTDGLNLGGRLAEIGLKCNYLGGTPCMPGANMYRGNEIDAWMTKRLGMYTDIPKKDFKDYLIIDHRGVMLSSQLDNTIFTSDPDIQTSEGFLGGNRGFTGIKYRNAMQLFMRRDIMRNYGDKHAEKSK